MALAILQCVALTTGESWVMGAGIDVLEQALVSQFAARVGRGKERSD
jgi:hypothetical protein